MLTTLRSFAKLSFNFNYNLVEIWDGYILNFPSHPATRRSTEWPLRLQREPDYPAGTGIPVPVSRNGIRIIQIWFRLKEPELSHSNPGTNQI